MNAHELKQKQVRLTKLEAEINEELEYIRGRKEAVNKMQDEMRALRKSIDDHFEAIKRAEQEPMITEHAFVRYFERVQGFDLEFVKSVILTPAVKAQIKMLGNGTYPVEGGFKIKVQDGRVVTVI